MKTIDEMLHLELLTPEQHQHISRQQLVGQLVGKRQRGFFSLGLLLARGHPATQQGGIEVRHRLGSHIANLNLISRMRSLPVGDELLGQLAGYRTLLAGAAFDNENTGHV